MVVVVSCIFLSTTYNSIGCYSIILVVKTNVLIEEKRE